MANLNQNNGEREQWGSKLGFILAASGSAVGLGNLVKFPAAAAKNGGGAFVLVYFIILFLVGFTLMLAEIAMGRHTGLNAIGAYRKISKKWAWVGGLGVLAGFMILSYYSVIGGWVINYLIKSFTGGLNVSDPAKLGEMFGTFITSSSGPLIYHGIFLLITMIIVIKGIGGGIEKSSKIMMPALLIMIVLIAIRAMTLPGASEGIKYLLVPDFSKITPEVVLTALGQVFFSLSLGMGCMITYGSYLDKETNIPQSATIIPLIDTGVALFAGLAVLPAVFAYNLDPNVGLGIIFNSFPAIFSQLPLGGLFAVIFFVLVLFAALSSSISLLEVCVAYVVDEYKMDRKIAVAGLGLIIFLVGSAASLSLGVWSDVKIFGMTIFDILDYGSANFLLPLGGLLLCIFVGWVWGTDNAIKEVTNGGKLEFKLSGLWTILIKYVGPIAIAMVFVQKIRELIG